METLLGYFINTIVTNVFADADGATAGSQALAPNSAALVKANASTYLIINDGAAGFQSAVQPFITALKLDADGRRFREYCGERARALGS